MTTARQYDVISGPIEIPELWRIYPGILYRLVSGWKLQGAESPEQLW